MFSLGCVVFLIGCGGVVGFFSGLLLCGESGVLKEWVIYGPTKPQQSKGQNQGQKQQQ